MDSCPICGGDCGLSRRGRCYRVQCLVCGTTSPWVVGRDAAVSLWNDHRPGQVWRTDKPDPDRLVLYRRGEWHGVKMGSILAPGTEWRYVDE